MPRQTLSFGGGLDRASGMMAVRPAALKDVRNVYLLAGKMEARRGNAVVGTLPGCDDVILIHALRSEQAGIAVGYVRASGTAKVFRTSGEGTSPSFIANWFTGGSTTIPPRVIAAEAYDKVFLAHDEPSLASRKATAYYNSATGLVTTLNLDLGGGAADVKFRGVAEYLGYLVGWGYGNSTEENRPELVRISLPGQPTVFNKEHYFIAGSRNDPVLACAPADTLKVLKQADSYQITGYARSNFGILPADRLFGVAGSRLALVVGRDLFYWSLEGPRVFQGNTSEDLSLPLGLPDDEPDDLPTAEDAIDGFACYEPERRIVHFVFGQRVYSLHLKDSTPRWTYTTLGFTPLCAGILYSGTPTSGGGGVSTPPTAYPDSLVLSSITATTATLTWDTNSVTGDEWFEVHARAAGGSWSQVEQGLTSGGATDTKPLVGLSPGTDYEIAVRYRRGSQFTAGYTSSDPATWPGGAQATFETALGAPTALWGAWARTGVFAERTRLEWTNTHADRETQILRDGSVVATVAAGIAAYEDASIAGETSYSYTVRHINGANFGTASGAVVLWAGPLAPTSLALASLAAESYSATWAMGTPGAQTEIYDDYSGGSTLRTTTAANEVSGGADLGPGSTGASVTVEVRHKVTSYGVNDFSDIASDLVNIT